MLTSYERQPDGCSPLGCGITLLVIGIVIALFGFFWHFPSLTATDGVIVENRRLVASWSHAIVYEYEVHGVRYRGERLLRYDTQFESFYQVGSPFHIFFVTAHPEVSYGPNRPFSWRIIVLGIFVSLLSGIVIFSARYE